MLTAMKTKIIAAIIVLTGLCINLSAQQTGYVHKPLSAFNGDTLAYLEHIAYAPGPAFGGRPISELVNKLGLPIKGVTYELDRGFSTQTLNCIVLILEEPNNYLYKQQHRIPRTVFKLYVKDMTTNTWVPAAEAKSKFGANEGSIIPYSEEIRQWIYKLKILYTGGVEAYQLP